MNQGQIFEMFAIKLNLVFLLLFFDVSVGFRRIQEGERVSTNKTYVVYLVKAQASSQQYDTWLCGGALVSSLFIVTSAACVDDVQFLYAIAGYDQYVKDEDLETNECTKQKKKKIIYTCIPMKYELQYDAVEKWSFIDIALVKVESAYDFTDNTYTKLCSYIPTTILINYETKYQAVDTDAMVLGWGHKEKWRQPEDHTNYNQKYLHYASTLIMDKKLCKKYYEMYPNMNDVIDQFMICTQDKGSINDKGEHEMKAIELMDGCKTKLNEELKGAECDGVTPDDNIVYHDLVIDYTRRETNKLNRTHNGSSIETLNINANFHEAGFENSRKYGICQNDHGGPLVTWVGSHEVLIGVASVFRVSDSSTCMGPFLYTSTQCNGAFLDCVLTNSELPETSKNRRAICDSPPIKRGYDTVERHISWKNHPSGPADNERAAAKVKYTGQQDSKQIQKDKVHKATNSSHTSGHNTSANYNRFTKLKKFSKTDMFVVRPQRPLRN